MEGLFQRLTFLDTLRMVPLRFSMAFVVARDWRSKAGSASFTSGQPITQLGPRMAVFYNHGALDLIAILCGMPERAGRIVHLATAQLQCALKLEAELDLIADDYDVNDFQVPSIEGHVQNEHHEGALLHRSG